MTDEARTLPPFTEPTARHVTRSAEAAWNSRDPERVLSGYASDAGWRDGGQRLSGHDAIRGFLQRKWRQELHRRTAMEMWSHTTNRISVRVEAEWQHARTGQWYRTTGIEHWEFDPQGLIHLRDASGDDEPISAGDRQIGIIRD